MTDKDDEKYWKELATMLVKDQMEAAKQLARRFGHDDVSIQAPYQEMLRRIKDGQY